MQVLQPLGLVQGDFPAPSGIWYHAGFCCTLRLCQQLCRMTTSSGRTSLQGSECQQQSMERSNRLPVAQHKLQVHHRGKGN